MATNNNNNTPLAPCGYVTVAECEAHREKLREKDTEIERKISEMLVSMATTQQQIKMLLMQYKILLKTINMSVLFVPLR